MTIDQELLNKAKLTKDSTAIEIYEAIQNRKVSSLGLYQEMQLLEEFLNKFKDDNQDRQMLLTLLGTKYAKNAKRDPEARQKAEDLFTEALNINYDDAETLAEYARLCQEIALDNNSDDAEKEFRTEQALALFGRAITLEGDELSQETLTDAAVFFEKLNMHTHALAFYEILRERYPDDRLAKDHRDGLLKSFTLAAVSDLKAALQEAIRSNEQPPLSNGNDNGDGPQGGTEFE